MKKETVFAVVFGILLGAGVAVFIIFKNHELQLDKNRAMGATGNQQIVTPVPGQTEERLTLDSPSDGSIVSQNSVTFSGRAPKQSLIVAESATSEKIFKNDSDQFSFDFALSPGENAILLSVFPADPQQRVQEKTLKIYFLDQKL